MRNKIMIVLLTCDIKVQRGTSISPLTAQSNAPGIQDSFLVRAKQTFTFAEKTNGD